MVCGNEAKTLWKVWKTPVWPCRHPALAGRVFRFEPHLHVQLLVTGKYVDIQDQFRGIPLFDVAVARKFSEQYGPIAEKLSLFLFVDTLSENATRGTSFWSKLYFLVARGSSIFVNVRTLSRDLKLSVAVRLAPHTVNVRQSFWCIRWSFAVVKLQSAAMRSRSRSSRRRRSFWKN